MKQKKGNTRKTGKEQYYTRPEIVEECLEQIEISSSEKYLEPAGGTGVFIEGLLNKNIPKENILSFDIEPKHPLVRKSNFLEETIYYNNLITISNPPFGRANSLSKKFFNHAAKFSKTIAFIVPKAWRKWSVQNSLDDNFHLIKDIDLSMKCFQDDTGKVFDGEFLSTIFQVWDRKEEKRKKIEIPDYKLIEKTTPKKADIALVVFGWSCGKVLRQFERKPNTTLMFLKVKDKSVIDALEKVDLSKFYKNVSYTYALSIKEINYCLNEYFNL